MPPFPIPPNMKTSTIQDIFRFVLGMAMGLAGASHLTFRRQEFQAQVPTWVPMDPDLVVVLSGVVELLFAAALLLLNKKKVWVGLALATFFVLIFPGNVHQYVQRIDAFGLDTDRARFIRLLFQPALVLWALWCTGALRALRGKAPHPR